MKYFIVVISLIAVCFISCSQDCKIEIQYLSTFVGSKMLQPGEEFPRWETEDLIALSLHLDTVETDKPNMYVPILLNQIAIMDNPFAKWNKQRTLLLMDLINLNLGDQRISPGMLNSNSKQCKYLKETIAIYHGICEDDSTFHKFLLTFDDGPFYGFESKEYLPKLDSISLKNLKSKLILRGNENMNTIELEGELGNRIWIRRLARSNEYNIRRITFSETPIKVEDDLGYKIGMVGDGEYLHLYLNTEGKFRMFFHSW